MSYCAHKIFFSIFYLRHTSLRKGDSFIICLHFMIYRPYNISVYSLVPNSFQFLCSKEHFLNFQLPLPSLFFLWLLSRAIKLFVEFNQRMGRVYVHITLLLLAICNLVLTDRNETMYLMSFNNKNRQNKGICPHKMKCIGSRH